MLNKIEYQAKAIITQLNITMESQDLIFDKKNLLTLALMGIFLAVALLLFTMISNNFKSHLSIHLSYILFIINIIPWLAVVIDLHRNKVKNRNIWMIRLLFTGNIASIVYLLQRDKYLKLYSF